MNALVLYDTPDAWGQRILSYMQQNGPRDIRYIDLNQQRITPCTGCFGCWLKTPGVCVIKDDALEVLQQEMHSDRVMYLCPVTWGGYSPVLKIYQDRALARTLPFFQSYKNEIHHSGRYKRYPLPFLVGYGSNTSPEESALFKKIGEDLNDNIHKSTIKTAVLRTKEDFAALHDFWEGTDR